MILYGIKAYNLEKAYKRLEEIDTELKHEYDEYGETVYASQLELEYEDNAISALLEMKKIMC